MEQSNPKKKERDNKTVVSSDDGSLKKLKTVPTNVKNPNVKKYPTTKGKKKM